MWKQQFVKIKGEVLREAIFIQFMGDNQKYGGLVA